MAAKTTDNVRIGPISILTLIAIICIAVLAVLAISTSHASLVISERQAISTNNMYLDEMAAQEFVAQIDEQLALIRLPGGRAVSDTAAEQAINATLDNVIQTARDSVNGRVQITAEYKNNELRADFTTDNVRTLSILLEIMPDGSCRVQEWKMAAVENETPPEGELWTGM